MKCGNKTVQKYADDFIEKAMQIEDITEADLLHDYLRGLPTDIRLAVKHRGVTGLEAVMTVADEEDQLIGGERAKGGRHAMQQRNTDGPAPMEIDRFAPLDLTVVDLDDDYDIVLGMPFCEEYIPIPHYREKALTIPVCESPTGRDLLLLDSEEYPAEGEGEDFFSQRELCWLMKRPSSRIHLFRLEAVRKGGVGNTLGVHSLQSAGKPGDPPPLSSFPLDHPINSSTYTGFQKHLQSKEVPPSVRPVLEKHFDRFPDELPGFSPHRRIECEIKLEAGHSPPARAPYRLSYGQLDELRRQLDSYLEKGHIRPSTSLYAAPVLFVQKADGMQRMCIDFTGLNKITVRDKFPIPHPEELLSHLHSAKFFSSLDLRQYFHQTRIREGDEEKTAFVTRYGSFEWLVMPFALCNAPSISMRLIMDVLRPLLDKCVVVFIDDVFVFSRTPEEHIEHINQVFSLLREHQLYVKVSKCAWLRTEAKFLGLVVDEKGVRPSHEKMQGLTEFAQPTDRTSLRQFLGLANWFRRFVPRFSFLAGPLTFLLQGNVPFEWKTAQSRAFAELKKAVQEHTTLAPPDPSKPVILVPDASQSAGAIGAVALQKDCATRRYRPLAFGSRRLTSTEAKYPVRELEFLAILVPSSTEVSHMGRAQRLPVRPRPLPEAVSVSVQPVGSLGAEFADLPDLVPEIEESQTPVREGDGQQSRAGVELQSLMVSTTQS
uniref:Reverse transcriptase domain-containing protein n=1 Tax=Chromera velia CCMP2878 TaxID=1169474 RepID=A0A0G4GL95_9ALVE|eukprot:Cvel_675.t1-p1 / transcript=Cvel_675.t1 / gene=Cvel_675 / organism=Chromera_velia_CCMP2878 / gene_product=Retrotransposable element Tf2 155 kDa protein type, putative / transcript_product=Retrotransposable element Tf2 155 kDa protein type, putative / location=Cvel_scaffold21:7521-10565(-) / protein_length=713 / sequence_SO=supercontig / SO=protein_coding / is_pseudo=false